MKIDRNILDNGKQIIHINYSKKTIAKIIAEAEKQQRKQQEEQAKLNLEEHEISEENI